MSAIIGIIVLVLIFKFLAVFLEFIFKGGIIAFFLIIIALMFLASLVS